MTFIKCVFMFSMTYTVGNKIFNEHKLKHECLHSQLLATWLLYNTSFLFTLKGLDIWQLYTLWNCFTEISRVWKGNTFLLLLQSSTDRQQCMFQLPNDLANQKQICFAHSTDLAPIHCFETMMMAQRDTSTVNYPFKRSSVAEPKYVTITDPFPFPFSCVNTLAMDWKFSRFLKKNLSFFWFCYFIQYCGITPSSPLSDVGCE